MPLPSSGEISFSAINTELGVAATTQRSLNDTTLRSLFGITTLAAQISLLDGRGKSSVKKLTISAHQQEMNLRTWALANGWDGTTAAEITVASGVYIWSNNIAVPAMRIDGTWPGGVTLVNNGFIMGKGGNGLTYGSSIANASPQSGGPAIVSTIPISVNCTNGYIGGGGGGGGGRIYSQAGLYTPTEAGGGGAGGGAGGSLYGDPAQSGSASYWAGGAGGSIGSAGANAQALPGGPNASASLAVGGGGGRIMPGARTAGERYDGNTTAELQAFPGRGGQAGGTGCHGLVFNFKDATPKYVVAGYGGGAGEAGESTQTGIDNFQGSGGGGGWGASGGNGGAFGSQADSSDYGWRVLGGLGGAAISASGNAITWIGGFPSGRIFGAVS